jgi:hypothetical protein
VLLAAHGAKVVVNDLGGSVTGDGADAKVADEVVEVIKARGGEAVANYDSVADFQKSVADREADFNSRLIEIFGYPYADDIGPTGSYPSGYDGPDLYHYMYEDSSRLLGIPTPPTYEFTVAVRDFVIAPDGGIFTTTNQIKFHVADNGFGLTKPAAWLGQRRAPGEVQLSHLDLLQAKARFEKAGVEYENLIKAGVIDPAKVTRLALQNAASISGSGSDSPVSGSAVATAVAN